MGDLASGVERAIGSIRTVRASGATDRESVAISELAEDAYEHRRARSPRSRRSSCPSPASPCRCRCSSCSASAASASPRARSRSPRLVAFILFLFLLIMPLGVDLRRDHLGEPGARRARPHPGDPRPAHRDAGRRRDRARVRDAGESSCRCARRRDRVPRRALPLPDAVVAARRTAESEALALLETRARRRALHAGTGDLDRPPSPESAARRLLRGAARRARRPGRPVGRGQEHDPRAHRALLRPDAAAPCGSTAIDIRTLDRAELRAPDRLRRAGRPDPRRHPRREPAAGLARRNRRRLRARAARREPRRGARAQPARPATPRSARTA